jgi:hypothetical protein
MYKYLLILLFFLSSNAIAQFHLIPLDNQIRTDFTKQHITWDWHNVLTFEFEPQYGPGIKFVDILHSNLISPSKDVQQWRDENRLKAFVFYKSQNMYNGLYLNSWSLTDRQTINTTKFSNHAAGFQSTYKPSIHFSVQPYLGYQQSENIALIDYGYDTGIDLELLRYSLSGYNTDIRLKSDYDFFPERQNSANSANIMIKKYFTSFTSDSLALRYSMNKQEYFAQNGYDIIQVDIEHMGLHNFLFYGLSPNSRLELITQIDSRNIYDDSPIVLNTSNQEVNANQRDVMRIENQFSYRYYSGNLFTRLGLHTFQETQDNQNILTDSKALHTSLNADFQYYPTISDDIVLKLSYVKFQYDTPDTITNHDDRDEIRFIGEFDYSHRFSPLLSANINFYANMFHKTYIFQEQSANNNWNRIYRLGGRIKYQFKQFRNTLQTYVLANYTVYDYDELLEESRSFVYRKYVISDSLSVPIFRNISIGFYGRLELEDRGTFFDRNFTQRLLDNNENIYYDIYLQKRNFLLLTVDVGFSVYLRQGWRHVPVKTLARDFSKTSPYIRVFYPITRRIQFRAFFSYTNLADTGRQNSQFAQGNIRLTYLW